MDERFRPQYHYTAEKNMINDPNGLLYLDGEWHLFHQYNQHEVVHWGHAISKDLLHWEHQEPAIFPDALGQIYSGTAVVDHHNTSGLRAGDGPVAVAFFTYADHHDGTQSQGIAYSNDRGRTWTTHPANPIIPNPGRRDFRDPKVFWHTASDSWILIVTGGDHLEFFRSPDLLHWTFAFSWGADDGSHGGVWECPDMFELPVDGTEERRWVISVSVDRGAPAGGSGMQYFVGRFDGHSFDNDNTPDTVLWQNWGQDYYAGITWENVPAADGRRIMIAWCDNWLYRFDTPTTPFNGQLTVPRELRLVATPSGTRLTAQPVAELAQLRRNTRRWGHRVIGTATQPTVDVGDAYEVLATFDTAASTASEYGVEVRVGAAETTRVGFDASRSVVFIDRSRSGTIPTSAFTIRHEAPGPGGTQDLRLRILVDRSSIEVFTSHGEQLTDLIFPDPTSTGFRLFAVGGSAALASLEIHPLARTWPQRRRQFTSIDGAWAQTRRGIQGSCEMVGLAHIGAGASIACTLEILGTRHGNPAQILGERAAGIVLGFDADERGGIAVVVDVGRQMLLARDLTTGEELAAVDAPVRTNTPYRMTASMADDAIEAHLEGIAALRVRTSLRPAEIALLVQDAEANFALDPGSA
jgi:fructan beta-fructosidase